MCLGQSAPTPPPTPKPPPLPPPTPPPAPKPDAPKPTQDLQASKEGTKLKSKTSAREKAGVVNKGTSQLRIPLNTGTDQGPAGGLNV